MLWTLKDIKRIGPIIQIIHKTLTAIAIKTPIIPTEIMISMILIFVMRIIIQTIGAHLLKKIVRITLQ